MNVLFVTEEPSVTGQEARCFSQSRVLKVAYNKFPLSKVLLYPSGVFEEVQEQIVSFIIFLTYDKR